MLAVSIQTLVLAGLLGNAPTDAAAELRYHGSLSKASRDGTEMGEPVKRFDLYCLSTPRGDGTLDVAYLVDEHGGGGWPWPARFGTVTASVAKGSNRGLIRLLHEHDRTQYTLAVPFPYFEFADRLAGDARWQAPRAAEFPNQRDSSEWKYHVASSKRIGSRDCWRVDVMNNFGPQESLWIEKGTPLVVKAERRVVIGRGDSHLLKLELDSVTPLDAAALARVRRPLASLLRLQEQLKRSDEKSAELSDAQLAMIAPRIKTLEQEAERTPFDRLVATIVRDVNTQSRRSGDVDSLAKRFIGKAAPPIQLTSLDGQPIDPAQNAGQIVVLHFWPYQGDPFPPEPYGQVGYLDFLHNRRKKNGVQVYGVAVDKRLADAARAPAVARSIRKLQSFMNLSYPIAVDDGRLLEKFGDPERTGAKLPLWVVIAADGTVREYKLGHYDIKTDEGLAQLDKAVLRLIREKRENRSAPTSPGRP